MKKVIILSSNGGCVNLASRIALDSQSINEPLQVFAQTKTPEEVFKYEARVHIIENTHVLPDEYKSGRELRKERRKNNRKK